MLVLFYLEGKTMKRDEKLDAKSQNLHDYFVALIKESRHN